MSDRFLRTELLLGNAAMEKLNNSRVAVFGVGGVGSYVAEALSRSGIGSIDLIDNDTVSITNINRQLCALSSTVGKYKVDVMRDRILDINPDIKVTAHKVFYMPETKNLFDFSEYDYIVDAVDTVTAKIEIIKNAEEKNVPVISSMGAGNKLSATSFEVSDIYKTSVCPLARVMRRELKARGIKKLKVVYSKEEPVIIKKNEEEGVKKPIPASISFVPSVAGLIIAGEVIKDLIKKN